MKRSWGDPLVYGAGLLGGLVAGNLTQLGQVNALVKAELLHDPDSYGVAVLVVTALFPMLVPGLRRLGWFVAAAGTLVVVVDPSLTRRPFRDGSSLLDGPNGTRAVVLAVVAGLVLGGALLSVGVGTAAERVATVTGLTVGFVAGASRAVAVLVIPGLSDAGAYAVSAGLFVAAGVVFLLRTRRPSTSDIPVWAGLVDLTVIVAAGGLSTFVAIYPRYYQADPPGIFLVPSWWSLELWWLSGALIVAALFALAMVRAGAAGGRWVLVGSTLAVSFEAFLNVGPGSRDPMGVQALDVAVVAVTAGLGVLAMSRVERAPWDAVGLGLLAVPLSLYHFLETGFFGPNGRTELGTVFAVFTFGSAGFATAAALTRLARLSARPEVGARAWRGVTIGVAAAILTSQAVYQPASQALAFGYYDANVIAPWEWSMLAAVVIAALAIASRRTRATAPADAPL
jgi:hypothetical protein